MEIKTAGQKLYGIYYLMAKINSLETPEFLLYFDLPKEEQKLWEMTAKRHKEQIYKEVEAKLREE